MLFFVLPLFNKNKAFLSTVKLHLIYRLMRGPAYTFCYLIPAGLILCMGFYLACFARKIAKVSAGMQIDARVRTKMVKRRNLQTSLFLRVSFILFVFFYII